jgi:hypothetical protein
LGHRPHGQRGAQTPLSWVIDHTVKGGHRPHSLGSLTPFSWIIDPPLSSSRRRILQNALTLSPLATRACRLKGSGKAARSIKEPSEARLRGLLRSPTPLSEGILGWGGDIRVPRAALPRCGSFGVWRSLAGSGGICLLIERTLGARADCPWRPKKGAQNQRAFLRRRKTAMERASARTAKIMR